MKKLSKRVTDNRTYKIVCFQESGDCCIRCRRRSNRNYYFFYNRDIVNPRWRRTRVIHEGEGKYPSWKMVSKNKKQWEQKPLVYKQTWSNWEQDWDDQTEIKW